MRSDPARREKKRIVVVGQLARRLIFDRVEARAPVRRRIAIEKDTRRAGMPLVRAGGQNTPG